MMSIGGKECTAEQTLRSCGMYNEPKVVGTLRGFIMLTLSSGQSLLPDTSANSKMVHGPVASASDISAASAPDSHAVGHKGMEPQVVTSKESVIIEVYDKLMAAPIALFAHAPTRPAHW